jgi:4-oxalocrotonate tautomerase
MRERAVPHVLVKLWPGKTEQQKKKLASEITKAVMATLNDSEESVSVAMEEVKARTGPRKSINPKSSPNETRSTKNQGTNPDSTVSRPSSVGHILYEAMARRTSANAAEDRRRLG